VDAIFLQVLLIVAIPRLPGDLFKAFENSSSALEVEEDDIEENETCLTCIYIHGKYRIEFEFFEDEN
jgi:hypothetical protein